MTVDDRGRMAGQRTVAAFQTSSDVAADYDELLQRRRSQRRNHTFALAAAVVVAVLAVLSVQAILTVDSKPQPMQPVPGIDVGDVPVWYDDAGLHRGDVVEQTPVEIRHRGVPGGDINGALALVRTGALYLDRATENVWFHPWGGEPRIVGHDSDAGPGGDPSGDIAVWFEGSFAELCCNVSDPELVIYDTAAGREIARVTVSRPRFLPFGSTCHSDGICNQSGNGFLQVSAERVVWAAYDGFGSAYMYEVHTGNISRVANIKLVDGQDAAVVDVHDDAAVYSVEDKSPWEWHLVLDMPGRAPQDYPEVDPRSRFSPNGNYVLSDDADIIDTGTGELWPVPKTRYSWSAWSYGDIALVDAKDELLACDAARRTCETLPAAGTPLMPTN